MGDRVVLRVQKSRARVAYLHNSNCADHKFLYLTAITNALRMKNQVVRKEPRAGMQAVQIRRQRMPPAAFPPAGIFRQKPLLKGPQTCAGNQPRSPKRLRCRTLPAQAAAVRPSCGVDGRAWAGHNGGMRPSPHDCPLAYATRLLAGKWKVRLLWAVHTAGVARFNQLKRELEGITDLALAKCLKEFVASGVLRREQFNEVPPHVEYSLTENGRNLVSALAEVRRWSQAQGS